MEKYKIIGGDGREYGPASLDELKSWIREGRVGRNTLVWSDDHNSWTPAGKLSELHEELQLLHGDLTDSSTLRRVGFWPRLGAHVMDIFILWTIFSFIWPMIAKSFGITEPEIPKTMTLEELLKFYNENQPFFSKQLAALFILYMFYEVMLNGRFGATLGKMAIGARIIRMDGSPIGYSTALVRWFACRLSDAACYIGYFFIAFREDKRGLHDLLVGTQVIYKR